MRLISIADANRDRRAGEYWPLMMKNVFFHTLQSWAVERGQVVRLFFIGFSGSLRLNTGNRCLGLLEAEDDEGLRGSHANMTDLHTSSSLFFLL